MMSGMLRIHSCMSEARAMVVYLYFGYYRNKSLAYRLNYVYRDGIACLLIALGIRYTRLFDGLVRVVRKALKSPAFERSEFSDAVFRQLFFNMRSPPFADTAWGYSFRIISVNAIR